MRRRTDRSRAAPSRTESTAAWARSLARGRSPHVVDGHPFREHSGRHWRETSNMEHSAHRMRGSTPPWPASGSSTPGGRANEQAPTRRVLAVLLLGMNLWVVALVWPLAGASDRGDGATALA